MTTDGIFEQEAILQRAKALLVGGRVYNRIPDDSELEKTENGSVLPYLVIDFATAYPLGQDRSLMGEEEQPHVLPVRIEAWGATKGIARSVAGAVRDQFIGWTPSPSASEISGTNGSSFSSNGGNAAPSRAVETVGLELTFNLGSNDGFVPDPTSPVGGTPVITIEQLIRQLLGEIDTTQVTYPFPNPIAQWSMVHAFGRIPSVRAYTPTGERLLVDEVSTDTTVVVTHANPTAGFVILS